MALRKSRSSRQDIRGVKSTKFLKTTFTPASAVDQVVEMSRRLRRNGSKNGSKNGNRNESTSIIIPPLSIVETPEALKESLRPGRIYGSKVQVSN